MRTFAISLTVIAYLTSSAFAEVGDPQLRTDHPWYPGELAISSFERLAATQAEVYKRVTGRSVKTDEDKALAAWLWRNTHFAHGECGSPDELDRGFRHGDWVRDYWLGLFGHGMALCGTTHAQWTAEMESLLGHGKARAVGVTGHNSFEVFLTGGAYGDGRWVLLDHDVSTVIFNENGSRLIGIDELKRDLSKLGNPAFKPGRQRGWRVSGLHDADVRGSFDSYRVAEYFAGFAGAPPMTHLRSGETLRRYHQPGLNAGKTFVYWGRNIAEQICVNNHARLTPIRKAVFELVSQATIPLSAYELLDQLKQNHPNAKPPTIYRALEFLIDQKLVHKLSTINAIIVCDCPGHQHAVLFLICKLCSQAKEIIEPALMLQLGHRIQASGYIEPYPVLEVMGTCPDCIEA